MKIYTIELTWWPKRGPVKCRRRYRYTGSKRTAHRIAKETLVRHDSRLKEFVVAIFGRDFVPVSRWVKFNGQIKKVN
jgi:hypothetical protein